MGWTIDTLAESFAAGNLLPPFAIGPFRILIRPVSLHVSSSVLCRSLVVCALPLGSSSTTTRRVRLGPTVDRTIPSKGREMAGNLSPLLGDRENAEESSTGRNGEQQEAGQADGSLVSYASVKLGRA